MSDHIAWSKYEFKYIYSFFLGQLETYKIDGGYPPGSNVLGLVCFSIVLGITLGKMGDLSRPLQQFFHSLSEAMMIITGWVIW